MAHIILDLLIIIYILINDIHVRRIEEDNKVLKEWIKFCYHVDLDRLTEFVEKNEDEMERNK